MLFRVKEAWVAAVWSSDFAVAVAYFVLASTLGDLTPQHEREAPVLEDPDGVKDPLMASLPYRSDRRQIVPATALVSICVVVPLAVQVLLSVVDFRPSVAVRGRLLSLLYATGSTVVTVDIIKRYCGYWRPYFFDECHYDAGGCTKKDGDIYRSFPSGHASTSAVTLVHTSLCLLGAARCGRPQPRLRGKVDVGNLTLLLCLGPAFLALWIAATRVKENDHWPADVVAGTAIGATFAATFYFRVFPGVFDVDSHLPRAPFLDEGSSSSRGGDYFPHPIIVAANNHHGAPPPQGQGNNHTDADDDNSSSASYEPPPASSRALGLGPNAQELC